MKITINDLSAYLVWIFTYAKMAWAELHYAQWGQSNVLESLEFEKINIAADSPLSST